MEFEWIYQLALHLFFENFNPQLNLSIEVADHLVDDLTQCHLLITNHLQMDGTLKAERSCLGLKYLRKSLVQKAHREGA